MEKDIPTNVPKKPLRKLNDKQVYILKLAYKFRFLTTHLLATYRNNLDHTVAFRPLEKLVEYGYLIKKTNNHYKIHGKNASYSLSLLGIKYLRANFSLSESVLHTMYKNSIVTDSFIDKQLDILRMFIALRRQTGDRYSQFTRSELTEDDNMPDQLPDLYMRRHDPQVGISNEYFVYHVTELQFSHIRKRIDPVLEHYETIGWDGEYPTILLVLQSSSIEYRIREYLEKRDFDLDLHILITAKKALLESEKTEIWAPYLTEQLLVNLD